VFFWIQRYHSFVSINRVYHLIYQRTGDTFAAELLTLLVPGEKKPAEFQFYKKFKKMLVKTKRDTIFKLFKKLRIVDEIQNYTMTLVFFELILKL
jgi:hypothetical protein